MSKLHSLEDWLNASTYKNKTIDFKISVVSSLKTSKKSFEVLTYKNKNILGWFTFIRYKDQKTGFQLSAHMWWNFNNLNNSLVEI